jgi:hypothetical protein
MGWSEGPACDFQYAHARARLASPLAELLSCQTDDGGKEEAMSERVKAWAMHAVIILMAAAIPFGAIMALWTDNVH